MTREELQFDLCEVRTAVSVSNAASRILIHDDEQRVLIEQLKEKVAAYEGGCLHDQLVDQAQKIEQLEHDSLWLKERDEIAKWYETLITRARIGTKNMPSMKVYIEQLEQQNTALREALQLALINLRAWNGEETWPLYKNSPEIRVIEPALTDHGGA